MNIRHCLDRLQNSEERVVFLEADGSERTESYAALYSDALLLLGVLNRADAKKGTHLLLLSKGVRAAVTALWACWLGGIVPVSGLRGEAGRPDFLEKRHPGCLIFSDSAEFTNSPRLVRWPAEPGAPGTPVPMADEDAALLQYTSGTADFPRCAVLSGANLYESGKASSVVVREGVRERYVSCLPLSHVFGLAANHLVPVYNGFFQCHAAPERFASDPSVWLAKCAEYGATVTGASSFGLELAIKSAEKLPKNADLSTLNVCFWGGETLDPALHERFTRAFSPFGLKKGVLLPAYGLSEASMGVCYTPPGEDLRVDYIDPSSVAAGGKLRFLPKGGMARVSLGVLDDCNVVEIRDDSGRPLPEEHLGGIFVRGTNVMKGYYKPAPAEPENPKGGWLDTGDLGYFRNGRLSVLARSKDVICVNGENYVRTELEKAAGFGALIETHGGLALCCENETKARMKAAAERVGERFGVPVRRAASLTSLPRNGKGLIDRVRLAAMWEDGALLKNAAALFSGEGTLSKKNEELASLWERALLVSGLNDGSHFFTCGGDSLSTIDLACAVEERYGVYLDASELAAHPRLSDMADFLEEKRTERFDPLFARIDTLLNTKKSAVVAIDGRCCSGKTTLAALLSEKYGCETLHMDDFFLPEALRAAERLRTPGGNVHYERAAEVLEAYKNGGAVYSPYLCSTGGFGEARELKKGALLVIEGSYACHPSLTGYYDLTVFLDVGKKEQERRIRARNGGDEECFLTRWVPLEEAYFDWLKGRFRFDMRF